MAQQINISDETYRDVEAFLASRGDTVDIDAFVNRTLQRTLFFDLVREIQERNKDVDPAVLQQEIDEAVASVRDERRKEMEANLSADRS